MATTPAQLRRPFFIVFAAVAVLWALGAFLVVPWIIGSAHAGQSLPFLNALIAGGADTPVDVYLGLWRRVALALGAVLFALGAFLAVWLVTPVGPRIRNEVLRAEPAVPVSSAFVLAGGLGLGFGLLEVAALALATAMRSFEYWNNLDYLWMTPTSVAVVFIGVVALIVLLSGRLREGVSLRTLTVVLGTIGALGVIRIVQLGIHPWAAFVLAAGVGVALMRGTVAHPSRAMAWMRRLTPVFAVVVAVALLVLQPGREWQERRVLAQLEAAPSTAPNVLLLVLDTARRQNLGIYGYPRPTSPNLDRFAERGVIFDQAFSTAGWTLPAHGSLFTGEEANVQSGNWGTPLHEDAVTLAEILQARGYATGGFVGNLSYTTRASGLAQGFMAYRDHQANLATWSTSSFAMDAILVRGRRYWPGGWNDFRRKLSTHVNAEFFRWLPQVEDRPFFAFLNYFDAHEPYEEGFLDWSREFADQPARDSTIAEPGVYHQITEAQHERVAKYDGALVYQDLAFGALIEALEERGLIENTLVLITADHGEHFFEYGLNSHANSLYTPLIHVPLVMVWPSRLPEGRRVANTVSLADLPATIEEWTGASTIALQGTSFANHLMAELQAEEGDSLDLPADWGDGALAEAHPTPFELQIGPILRGPIRSIAEGGFHYILNGDGVAELFNVIEDPMEERDLLLDPTPAHDSIGRTLRRNLDAGFGNSR